MIQNIAFFMVLSFAYTLVFASIAQAGVVRSPSQGTRSVPTTKATQTHVPLKSHKQSTPQVSPSLVAPKPLSKPQKASLDAMPRSAEKKAVDTPAQPKPLPIGRPPEPKPGSRKGQDNPLIAEVVHDLPDGGVMILTTRGIGENGRDGHTDNVMIKNKHGRLIEHTSTIYRRGSSFGVRINLMNPFGPMELVPQIYPEDFRMEDFRR